MVEQEAAMITPSRVLVALSRQMGAGGAYVGQAVSRQLGVRYVDREILNEAAKILGRDDTELESLEERVTGLWSRMAGVLAWGAPEAAYVPPPMPTLYEEDVFAVEAKVIRETAAREDAVFVGRGATWILRLEANLLSVFLHAPEPFRVERVMRDYKMTDLDAARELVRRSDRHRSRFLQSLSGVSWLDTSQYHVSVDTGTVGLDETVDLLTRLVMARRG
jgi:cytidylate kinase